MISDETYEGFTLKYHGEGGFFPDNVIHRLDVQWAEHPVFYTWKPFESRFAYYSLGIIKVTRCLIHIYNIVIDLSLEDDLLATYF